MKIERSKNTFKNILSGFLNKTVALIIPFVVRTVLISELGMSYLGLNSLFTSVLNVLNLAELGIGSAIIYNLYGAIAKDDSALICSLLNFYKKIYLCIGLIILVCGICLLPFIPSICKTDIPADINLYLLFIIYLFNTVASYFIFAYRSCLLNAFQKVYIINNINTLVNFILYCCQIVILKLGKNFYLYVLVIILATCINNLICAFYSYKKYPMYRTVGKLDYNCKKDIYAKVKALFMYKVGGVVLTSVDSIVISAYLGLIVLGRYNSYYYLITTLFGFLQIYYNSMIAGVGNSIAVENIQKNKSDFDNLQFLQTWIVGWCAICLICLFQPFMALWVGKNNMFTMYVVVCFALYFYLWKMMDIVNLYKEAAGLWEYDKFRPLIAAIVNLILNIILVNCIGIYGILISTIISIAIIILPWSVYVLYKYYFREGIKKFFTEYLSNFMLTCINAVLTYGICLLVSNDYFSFFIKCCICLVVPNILYVAFYMRDSQFRNTYQWLILKLSILGK